ncbi:MAG TPA: exosortase A [Stellaceae bacterium]|nr:exosortase A [Stellaceae bacterium]
MDFSHRPASLARRAPPEVAVGVAEHPARRAAVAPGWRTAAIVITAAILCFGLVFRHDTEVAVVTWIGTTAYNHCFLIVPLAGFLLWERRAVFSAVSPTPSFWPLVAMPVLSAVWLAAAVLDLNEGRQLAVVAMFEIVLLATLGMQAFKLLLAPFLFLFFLVPSGEFLIPILQRITADITVHGLQLLHIPVYSEGMIIEIPEGKFEIAEACAGLRFLIASIVFGFFFSVVMYRSFFRRALFIALSLVVPVGANGLRALGIIVLAHLEGSAAAVEADHVLYGWIFFSLVILLLIAIGMSFVDKGDALAPVRPGSGGRQPPWRFAAVSMAAVLLALLGPAYGARLDSQFPASEPALAQPPQPGSPWHELARDTVGWRPMVRGADQELLQSFEEPGSGVVVRFVALYRLRAVGNALTRSDNRMADDVIWQLEAQGRRDVSIGDQKIAVTTSEIVSGAHRRLVWSFYLVDGKITARLLEAKLLQARAVLLRRASIAASVAISAGEDDPEHPAAQQLLRFLQASRPLLRYLDASSLGKAASIGGRSPSNTPR